MYVLDGFISHVGVGHEDDPPGRGSGRYGWGTGVNPGQHQHGFLEEVKKLRQKNFTNAEIAKALLGQKGVDKNGNPIWANTTDLRARISVETTNKRRINVERAVKLLDECNGNVSEVARRMGKNESSVRSLLDPIKAERTDRYQSTAEMLKKIVDEKGIIDIGKDSELYLGVTEITKKVAVEILEKEGYVKSWVKVPQLGTQHETTMVVLAPPGTTHGEIQKEKYNIQPITTFTPDQGKTWWTPEYPESVNSKRILVRYKEEGGQDKDGVIELRRGVEDLSLGGSQYSQVRIAVDDTHYMKGMAMYADDIPDGYDIIYNTNKKKGTPLMSPNDNDSQVLKPMKKNKDGEIDKNNPFGALIKGPKERNGIVSAAGQRHYIDSDGKEKLSPINKLQDEGDWDSWSRNLASQFLSKQPMKLINQQLNLSILDKRDELEKIKNLTNPAIKQRLLEDYASGCDANAADLSAKGFKNQAFQVLLPIPSMKDNEIYAPNYNDGDTVALVRYPHGGTFEIPILTVNNKQKNAKSVMRNATDAVGISQKNADILSGADFDGDTALVIPLASNKLSVKTTKRPDSLKDFDPKELYKLSDSAPRITNSTKQKEMGIITNLITDMTVGGAPLSDIVKATKHSMVVIDSEKHHLDYKQSAEDNNIYNLKKEYQGKLKDDGKIKFGASTILSRAKSKVYVDDRKELTDTKKMTPEQLARWNQGKIVWIPTEKKKNTQIKDPNKMTPEELVLYNSGKKVYRKTNENKQVKVPQMDLADDAMDLVHNKDNPKEVAYAHYANDLKALADEARRVSRSIQRTPVNTSAKKVYASEVESLNASLRRARMNAPKERQAQTLGNAIARATFDDNPDMDYEHRKREEARALTEARAIVGAKKQLVSISDKEWEAIQAGAISFSKLNEILNNTDLEAFKKRATPRRSESASLTNTEIAKAKAMYSSGMYTQKEIAEALGVSVSTVSKAVRS